MRTRKLRISSGPHVSAINMIVILIIKKRKSCAINYEINCALYRSTTIWNKTYQISGKRLTLSHKYWSMIYIWPEGRVLIIFYIKHPLVWDIPYFSVSQPAVRVPPGVSGTFRSTLIFCNLFIYLYVILYTVHNKICTSNCNKWICILSVITLRKQLTYTEKFILGHLWEFLRLRST